MNSKVKRTSIAAVTVASFAIFAGSVSAQPGPGNAPGGPGGRSGEGRPPMEQPFGQNGETPFNPDRNSNQPPFNQDGSTNQPPFAQGDRPNRPGVDLLQAVVEASGLTPAEIRQQLQDGSTIDEILAAAGTSLEAIIDQAVTDGELTEEQAAALKDRIAAGDFLSIPGFMGAPGRDHLPVRSAIRGAVEAAVDLTGLTAVEIRQQLQDGATLKEILEANGSSVEVLVEALLTKASERLNAQVEAGRITEEQAAARLEELKTHLTERLNETNAAQNNSTQEAAEDPADA